MTMELEWRTRDSYRRNKYSNAYLYEHKFKEKYAVQVVSPSGYGFRIFNHKFQAKRLFKQAQSLRVIDGKLLAPEEYFQEMQYKRNNAPYHYDEKTRERVFALIDEGYTARDVAYMSDISELTIRNWLKAKGYTRVGGKKAGRWEYAMH